MLFLFQMVIFFAILNRQRSVLSLVADITRVPTADHRLLNAAVPALTPYIQWVQQWINGHEVSMFGIEHSHKVQGIFILVRKIISVCQGLNQSCGIGCLNQIRFIQFFIQYYPTFFFLFLDFSRLFDQPIPQLQFKIRWFPPIVERGNNSGENQFSLNNNTQQ